MKRKLRGKNGRQRSKKERILLCAEMLDPTDIPEDLRDTVRLEQDPDGMFRHPPFRYRPVPIAEGDTLYKTAQEKGCSITSYDTGDQRPWDRREILMIAALGIFTVVPWLLRGFRRGDNQGIQNAPLADTQILPNDGNLNAEDPDNGGNLPPAEDAVPPPDNNGNLPPAGDEKAPPAFRWLPPTLPSLREWCVVAVVALGTALSGVLDIVVSIIHRFWGNNVSDTGSLPGNIQSVVKDDSPTNDSDGGLSTDHTLDAPADNSTCALRDTMQGFLDTLNSQNDSCPYLASIAGEGEFSSVTSEKSTSIQPFEHFDTHPRPPLVDNNRDYPLSGPKIAPAANHWFTSTDPIYILQLAAVVVIAYFLVPRVRTCWVNGLFPGTQPVKNDGQKQGSGDSNASSITSFRNQSTQKDKHMKSDSHVKKVPTDGDNYHKLSSLESTEETATGEISYEDFMPVRREIVSVDIPLSPDTPAGSSDAATPLRSTPPAGNVSTAVLAQQINAMSDTGHPEGGSPATLSDAGSPMALMTARLRDIRKKGRENK